MLIQAREWMNSTRLDPDLFCVVARLMEDYLGADPADQAKFSSWGFDLLFMVEAAMYMRRDGFQNEASFRGFEAVAISIIRTPGGAQWWEEARRVWGQDAVDHITARLQETVDDIPPWNELRPEFKRFVARADESPINESAST